MKTMNQSLAELNLAGRISLNDGLSYSQNPQELGEILSRQKTPAFS